MRRFLLLVLCLLPLVLQSKSKKQGEGDDGRSSYEIGMMARLSGDDAKSKELLEKAASSSGRYADLARLELVRLAAKDPAGKDRIAALRQMIEAFEDEKIKDEASMAAASGLYVSGNPDDALLLALELAQNRPQSQLADDALLLAGEIYILKRSLPAAVDRLLFLVDRYPQSNSTYRAYLLLARIYSFPGEYESPGRERAARMQAEKIAEKTGRFPDAGPSAAGMVE